MKESVNWDNHPARIKMRGFESEIANLKNTLAQKDAEINSIRSQTSSVSQKDSEINSWKGYYNSAQSQVNSLNASLLAKNSELNSIKTQKDSEISSLKGVCSSYQVQLAQLQDQLNEKNKESQDKTLIDALQEELAGAQKNIKEIEIDKEKLSNELIDKDKKLNLLQKNFTEAEAKIDFMNKFFEDVKQEKLELKAEKLELKKEIKLYKKSFLKKHDLSVSQSIEIEKLRKEMLEMSSMSISRIRNHEEEKEESNFGDDDDVLHTTFSHPVRSRANSDANKKLPGIKENSGSENASPVKAFNDIMFPLEQNNTVESELVQTTGVKLLGDDFSILENEGL